VGDRLLAAERGMNTSHTGGGKTSSDGIGHLQYLLGLGGGLVSGATGLVGVDEAAAGVDAEG
jgi:hypothetical protein